MDTSISIPKNGWHKELQEAEEASKERPRDADSQFRVIQASLRVAIASRKLRQWGKCKKAAQLGLSLEPNATTTKKLRECLNVAKQELEKLESDKSMMDDGSYGKGLLERVAGGVVNINDGLLLVYPTFSNLHPLQYATLVGDIEFVEQLLARGVAVDYPALVTPPKHERIKNNSIAPRGSTALLLATASLALMAKTGPHPVMFPFGMENIDNVVACCVRLVMAGADCKTKLYVPATSSALPNQLLRQFHGMSVEQLAVASGKTKLVEAIETMEGGDRFGVTQCRCGSRLSWNECHGFGKNKSLISVQDDNGVVYWSCSPLSRCPCQPVVRNHSVATVAGKTYLDCCWKRKAHFLNDTTGEFLRASSDGSPLVCCSEIFCQKIESKSKEFAVCSRCKLYAYCSKACQKTNWKLHKERCYSRK